MNILLIPNHAQGHLFWENVFSFIYFFYNFLNLSLVVLLFDRHGDKSKKSKNMRTSPVAVLQNFFVLSFCSNPHKFYQFQLPVESVFNTKYTIVFSNALFKTTAPHVERQRRVRLRSGRPKPAHQSRDTAFYELIILFINCNLSIKARADDVRRGPRLART